MKRARNGFRMLRREQRPPDRLDEPCRAARKPTAPSRCPECGATFHDGRWMWRDAAPGAAGLSCPACHRTRDNQPAGFITLEGPFVSARFDELMQAVGNCESAEKAEHPLERIMDVDRLHDHILVTTTGLHLAGEIAERLHDAYKGVLDFHYQDDNLLRISGAR